MENLLTLTIQSTHYYLVDFGRGKLLVDAGWVDQLPRFLHQLKQSGSSLSEIRYVMMTHHHPDHAGLIQTIRRMSGAKLLLHANQLPYLEKVGDYFRGNSNFEPVKLTPQDLVGPTREDLIRIGVAGEIIPTPGHSDDSISLVLDSGMAFIGDLHLTDLVDPLNTKNYQLTRESWRALALRSVKTVYPAHGSPFPFQAVRARLEAE